MNKPDIRDFLPLSETTFYILISLLPEPRHGYAILKKVQSLSEGRIILGTGTLYGALKRMLEQGWIARRADPAASSGNPGRPRKVYSLSALGRRIIDAETARLQSLVRAARPRIKSGAA